MFSFSLQSCKLGRKKKRVNIEKTWLDQANLPGEEERVGVSWPLNGAKGPAVPEIQSSMFDALVLQGAKSKC